MTFDFSSYVALNSPANRTQYDYALFARLAGFTESTLKKFWPPVKKKGIENHDNFGKFLAGTAVTVPPTSKVGGGKKRKIADTDTEAELQPKSAFPKSSDSTTANVKPKKAPAKGRGKKAKTGEAEDEETVKEDQSVDGGDGV